MHAGKKNEQVDGPNASSSSVYHQLTCRFSMLFNHLEYHDRLYEVYNYFANSIQMYTTAIERVYHLFPTTTLSTY